MIKLSPRAKKAVEKSRNEKPDFFDFNTAKPQRTAIMDRQDDLDSSGASHDKNGTTLLDLLQQVGAQIHYEEGKPVLRFDPPLKSESLDTERWAKALELEDMFWKTTP